MTNFSVSSAVANQITIKSVGYSYAFKTTHWTNATYPDLFGQDRTYAPIWLASREVEFAANGTDVAFGLRTINYGTVAFGSMCDTTKYIWRFDKLVSPVVNLKSTFKYSKQTNGSWNVSK